MRNEEGRVQVRSDSQEYSCGINQSPTDGCPLREEKQARQGQSYDGFGKMCCWVSGTYAATLWKAAPVQALHNCARRQKHTGAVNTRRASTWLLHHT